MMRRHVSSYSPAIETESRGRGESSTRLVCLLRRLTRSPVLPLALLMASAARPETLYNGIVLPFPWPPLQSPNQVYQIPSYITNPPAVIPIDLGRQLLVDDFLVAQTTLTRTPHRPVMYSGNPILSPGAFPDADNNAMPFSDGVWYDPADATFKMWYFGGYGNMISYATSTDGIRWNKPAIPGAAVPNSNMVLQVGGTRDSATEWMDLNDIASRKFKAFASYPLASQDRQELVWVSPDGIHWTSQTQYVINLPWAGDRSTMFYNPFRKVWVSSARDNATLPAVNGFASHRSRVRDYAESPDLSNWTPSHPSVDLKNFWIGPDINDPPYSTGSTTYPELYNLDAVAYESLMVGLFSWFYSDQELVELGVGFSRDGYQWVRPTRGAGPLAFIPASNQAGTWNGYNTQSAGGGFLVVGDQLYFYFSGRNYLHNLSGQAFTGLATLRRDGFYSMDAGAAEGQLTTRPVQFSGSHFFVNVQNPSGTLFVEILDAGSGQVIAPYSRANCSPVSVDKTLQEVTWNGAADLSALAGRTVQFRFYLTNGELYSFWVSPDATGRSNGYVAAGGPGFSGPTDASTGGSLGPAITAQPMDRTVTAGQTATFSAAASGTLPLSYQWRKNGMNIGGANAASYTTSPTTTADNGATFLVAVSNSFGAVTSDAATLTVNPGVAPSIVTQPVNQTVTAGKTATFSVAAAGSPPLSYQWQKNGVNIATSANAASYTTPPTTTTDNGAAFRVAVSNPSSTITSQSAALTVTASPAAPSIKTQPANQTVTVGQAATFTVSASGTQPLLYQWQKNGVSIASAAAASYTTPPTKLADNGAAFLVTVSNSLGSVISRVATLTTKAVVPSVTTPPRSQTVTLGQTATFQVSVSGTAPFGYQWQRNGVNISSAGSSAYTTPPTTSADSGASYRVVVNNSAGSVTSKSGTLTVLIIKPSITTQPANQSVALNQSATFSVTATGSAPLTYQWRRSGKNIPGASASSYTTPPATAADNNSVFNVLVSNAGGSVTSLSAVLKVGTVSSKR